MWNVVGGAILLVVLVMGLVIWRTIGRNRKGDIISIVAFRTSPRKLTEADVRQAARRAFGREMKVENIPSPGKARLFLISADDVPPCAVIDTHERYDSGGQGNATQSATDYEHPEVREALAAHTAWISVDAMGITSDQLDAASIKVIQQQLAKLLHEFVDEDSTLLYETAGGRFGKLDAQSVRALERGDVDTIFGDDDMQQPMIQIGPEDDEIIAATEEAKRRLPEFSRAVSSGQCTSALVKGGLPTADGRREYIWLSMVDSLPDGFLARVENNANDPALPKKGSVIELKAEDVVDWMYLDASGKQRGGFVERVLVRRMDQ